MKILRPAENTEFYSAVEMIKNAILQSQQRALGAINQEQLAFGFKRYGFPEGLERFVYLEVMI